MCGMAGARDLGNTGKDQNLAAFFTELQLHAVQGRGRESAGIAVCQNGKIKVCRKEGRVHEIFTEKVISKLVGSAAIGQNRYSTTGASTLGNAQPIKVNGRHTIAIAHNGNIDSVPLRSELLARGAKLIGDSDTGLIAYLIAHSRQPILEDAIRETCSRIIGAYSLLILSEEKMIAVRDPNGFHPLHYGYYNDDSVGEFYFVASETCALDHLEPEWQKEVAPGQMIIFSDDGYRVEECCRISNSSITPTVRKCFFEKEYLGRPDSLYDGVYNEIFRNALGGELFNEHPELKGLIDVLIPTPNSGIPGTIGLHAASGIPYARGIVKNPDAGRLFIHPNPEFRKLAVRREYNIIKDLVTGKRVGVVDDSIVRGSTQTGLVSLLFAAGAIEVYVISICPPIRYPCYYGIDMKTYDELIAYNRTPEEVAKELGATGVFYLSKNGLTKVIESNSGGQSHCYACLDGNYPIKFSHMEELVTV